jgi:hypothetical protein
MCLNCLSLKFLNFKVCDSNLRVEILHILNFIKLLTQVNKYFFINLTNVEISIYIMPIFLKI